jgi:SnoaL-like domain
VIDAYAHNADRRLSRDQAALFTEDAVLDVYQGDTEKTKAVQSLRGRSELEKRFRESLNPYEMTMHFNGQSTLRIEGNRATGETYCMAHHFLNEGGRRKILVMGIPYEDTFGYVLLGCPRVQPHARCL